MYLLAKALFLAKSLALFLNTLKLGLISLSADLEVKTKFDTFLDHSGAIGRRYRRLDEIGAPFAITIDHQTKDDNTVTIRSRDSMSQDRVKIADLEAILSKETKFP